MMTCVFAALPDVKHFEPAFTLSDMSSITLEPFA